ncbi:GH92 family glycosyl hydrolase [Gluconacetobacter sacchari]|uniref:GH92 family glycosyl hydrolase n=1 Tax=Gluconacetobacter sacchari TaxID=92759 RepID=UPI001C7FD1EC|nr:GH92 family glycosyl hydrolase [Gluconacetobacter sacchari]
MSRYVVLACALLGLAGVVAGGPARGEDLVDLVHPLIGTGGGPIGYGRTMPVVTPPFGMTGWVAQTRQSGHPGLSYYHKDRSISGFVGTHQAALWMGDYGEVVIMPESGAARSGVAERALPFSHRDEVARPDYYRVVMGPEGRAIRAEMTAAAHAALFRFTFPAGAARRVMVEASRPGYAGGVRVDEAKGEITGYDPRRSDADLGPLKLPQFRGYFVVQFSRPARMSVYPAMPPPDGATDRERGAFATFDPGTDAVEVRVGTSFISVEQARENLRREIPGWDFEAVRRTLHDAWQEKLGRIAVEGLDDAQRHIFYTALYHALLYPRSLSEYGRYYGAFDDRVHEGASYTDFATWDIFRAEFSLLTLVAPERVGGMIQALLQDYRQGGWMPKWPNPSYTNIMIGTHADSLVAEAIGKGFAGFDRSLAWEAVRKDATVPPDGDATNDWRDRKPGTPYEARGGLGHALRLGYIPADRTAEAASSTLDDAYDDWCVAQVAKAVGRRTEYEHFLRRSMDYRTLFNPATGFMQARKLDGSWAGPDAGWTEGGKWVYTFDVLHDVGGLIGLMGGRAALAARLDRYFDGNYDWHSNEPSHHVPYLYDFVGQPWKTQARVREIMRTEYADTVSGLDGDDDCGQMSAWYVFSALGFYPVNPASGVYMIGSPLVSRARLRMADGAVFTVVADRNGADDPYIRSAMLGGAPLPVPMLTYQDMMAARTLHLVMAARPGRWGARWIAPGLR